MRRTTVGICLCGALGAALVLVTACSPEESSSRPAAETARTFDRLGYEFAPPAGWEVTEGYLDWKERGTRPHRGTPYFDTFSEPGLTRDPWIVIGKRSASSTASLEDWVSDLERLEMITYPPDECLPPEDQTIATLGGEPALLRGFHCPVDGPDAWGAMVLALHGTTGWMAMCYSEAEVGDLAALKDSCEGWLASFGYLD